MITCFNGDGMPTSEGLDYLRGTNRWPDKVFGPWVAVLDPGEEPFFARWVEDGGCPGEAWNFRLAYLNLFESSRTWVRAA